MNPQALLRAICDDPADDLPRLAYADWLEEQGDAAGRARAAFIRAQVERARRPVGEARWLELADREELLWEAHGERWLAEVPGWAHRTSHPGRPVNFVRGFVGRVYCDAEDFRTSGMQLTREAPIEEAWLACRAGVPLEYGQSAPALAHVRALGIHRAVLPAEVLSELALLPRLTQVELFFDEWGGPAPDWVACPRLESVSLGAARLPWPVVEGLLRAPGPRLRHVGLVGRGPQRGPLPLLLASPLHAQLGSLSLRRPVLVKEEFRRFVQAPASAGLEELRLRECRVGAAYVKTIVESPHLARLRVLELGRNNAGDAGARLLAETTKLPGLRYLGLGHNRISAQGMEALLDSPNLGELRWLDLRGNETGVRIARRLMASTCLPSPCRVLLGAIDRFLPPDLVESLRERYGPTCFRAHLPEDEMTSCHSTPRVWAGVRTSL